MYFSQGVWPAALALALLYLTVLSLGLLMTAYLKWQGMTEAELSLYRGAGAISGLLATVVFPMLHTRLGQSCLQFTAFKHLNYAVQVSNVSCHSWEWVCHYLAWKHRSM